MCSLLDFILHFYERMMMMMMMMMDKSRCFSTARPALDILEVILVLVCGGEYPASTTTMQDIK